MLSGGISGAGVVREGRLHKRQTTGTPCGYGKSSWGKTGGTNGRERSMMQGTWDMENKVKSQFYGQWYHFGEWGRSFSWCPMHEHCGKTSLFTSNVEEEGNAAHADSRIHITRKRQREDAQIRPRSPRAGTCVGLPRSRVLTRSVRLRAR